MGQGRVCTSETKAFSFTHRTKVFADGTVQKNNAGFDFLGYKIKRGYRMLHLPESKIRSQARQDALYAYPKEKSIRRFMDQVRQRTKRTTPLGTEELIAGLNPLLRGWGEYYKRAYIRKLFQRLDGWIRLPASQLYGEYELVRLLYLIPSLASWHR